MRSKVCGSQGNFCIKRVMAGKFGVYRMRSYLKQEVFNGEKKWRKKNHILRSTHTRENPHPRPRVQVSTGWGKGFQKPGYPDPFMGIFPRSEEGRVGKECVP